MDNEKPVFAEGFRAGSFPRLTGTHMIDEVHSNRHARLLHMHEHELELFYVYSGGGQYIVNGCSYHVQHGDIVVCNARVLHGEEPSEQRQMRSYSIALQDVYVNGLPDNQLIDEKVEPVISSGILSEQVGQMMRLIYLLQSKQGHLNQICNHTALAVLLLTYDLLSSRDRHQNKNSGNETNLLARRVQHYLDDHYCEPLTLQSISLVLHISEYYLAHVFKAEMGMPPMQYVMKRRMGEAQTLLMDTNLPIAQISEQLGYGNPWNFSSAFKKCVGVTPSQYRKIFCVMSE